MKKALILAVASLFATNAFAQDAKEATKQNIESVVQTAQVYVEAAIELTKEKAEAWNEETGIFYTDKDGQLMVDRNNAYKYAKQKEKAWDRGVSKLGKLLFGDESAFDDSLKFEK